MIYCVGVGPGDPELMTLKAVRIIREYEIIAVPLVVTGTSPRESLAYRIALGSVPELADKEILGLHLPMTRDEEVLRRKHREAADLLEKRAADGTDIAVLTLGDPAVYSTFSYIQELLRADGFETGMVSGVTSFSAAAASLNMPLVKGEEELRVIPAAGLTGDYLSSAGEAALVLMKAGRQRGRVKEVLEKAGRGAAAVENCGMDNEVVCRSLQEIPGNAGYFTVVISKGGRLSGHLFT